MKQLLLNSYFGHLALVFRDRMNLIFAAIFNPEAVGTIANDQLASLLISRICQSNSVFVDVGAHIGSITSEVHLHDSEIHIIAVEAIPEKVAKLRRKFPFAEIHECALGEAEGEVSFFVNIEKSGYSSLRSPAADDFSTKEITVPMKKLDSIVGSKNVDAIKIDVEGAELGVLLGSKNLLSDSRPTIMFESPLISNNSLGYTKEKLWQYFDSLDYLVVIPNRVAHNDEGLSLDCFIDSHIYPRRTTNYFAIPKERRVEIRGYARKIVDSKKS